MRRMVVRNQPGSDGGYRISENVLARNAIGLLLHSSGAATLVSDNVFLHNFAASGAASGNGIYSERASNVQIVDNRFQNNERVGVLTAVGPNGGANNVSSRNESIDEGAVVFVNQSGLRIADNIFRGGNFSAIGLGGDGLRDVDVVGNTITGRTGAFTNGIRLLNFSSDPARGNGILIGPEGYDGNLTIARNRIVDNSGAGLRNEDPDADIDASDNWWGCNLGPGLPGCDSVTSPGGSNPTIPPWLSLSLSANPLAVPAGGTSSLLADLANLSGGGRSGGPFFDSAVARFAAVPAATLSPASAPFDTELQTRSALTTGAQPAKELSTTVDHQTVRIVLHDPPAPDLKPDLRPDDDTLTPDEKIAIVVQVANEGNAPAQRVVACLELSAQLQQTTGRCKKVARLAAGHSFLFRVLGQARRGNCEPARRAVHRLTVRSESERRIIRRIQTRLRSGPCFTG